MFVCNRTDTISLPSRELGQAPMLLVFLTLRQALSSHQRQQLVLMYWLQDRDGMPNQPTNSSQARRPGLKFCWDISIYMVGIIYPFLYGNSAKISAKRCLCLRKTCTGLLSQSTNQQLQGSVLWSKILMGHNLSPPTPLIGIVVR